MMDGRAWDALGVVALLTLVIVLAAFGVWGWSAINTSIGSPTRTANVGVVGNTGEATVYRVFDEEQGVWCYIVGDNRGGIACLREVVKHADVPDLTGRLVFLPNLGVHRAPRPKPRVARVDATEGP